MDRCPAQHRAAGQLFDYEDDEVFFPTLQDSEHEICLDIKGEFKVDMPAIGSEVVFLAKKGNQLFFFSSSSFFFNDTFTSYRASLHASV